MVETNLFGDPELKDDENVYVKGTAAKKKQKDLSNETSVEFVLEVVCNDEKQQEQLFNELTERGHPVRVLTL